MEIETVTVIELQWEGPFGWPGLPRSDEVKCINDFDTAAVASAPGVYLWTVEHADGFLIYTAGITCRPFIQRFKEHTRYYRAGVYTIFDATSLKKGIRQKVWPGFWFRKRSPEMLLEYERRSKDIHVAAEKLLSHYRIFVAPVGLGRRILQRLEASIMSNLYAASGAASVVPDRGMALAPRWDTEQPILVRSFAPVLLHGLPLEFEA
jgi:hypothetical protein